MFSYTINGVCYTQTPVVLGQFVQLTKIIMSLTGKIEDFASFIDSAGDELPNLLAIVLNPEGVKKKDKNLAQLADELADNIDLETTEAVVTDFFSCNPNILSLIEKTDKMTGMVGEIFGKMTLKFLSTAYASSLLEATSPSETESSGDLQPQS